MSKQFNITEEVLQGEILSPLLFLSFIADVENFLRANGCLGINIDGFHDVLILMYANDLVICASSLADLKKKLKL